MSMVKHWIYQSYNKMILGEIHLFSKFIPLWMGEGEILQLIIQPRQTLRKKQIDILYNTWINQFWIIVGK